MTNTTVGVIWDVESRNDLWYSKNAQIVPTNLNTDLEAIPTVRSTGCLRDIANANQALHLYDAYLGPETIVTDCNFTTDPAITDTTSFAQTVVYLKNKFPGLGVGSYISAFVPFTEHSDSYAQIPIGRLDISLFSGDEILIPSETAPFVDFVNAGTRAKLVSLITQEALERKNTYGVKWMYTDNWVWNPTGDAVDTLPTNLWSLDDQLTYMEELTASLHAIGVRHIPNFHILVGATYLSDDDYTRIGQAADMISFERAADSVVIADSAGISRLVDAYQTLNTYTTPIMIPQSYQALYDGTYYNGSFTDPFLAEARMLAGFALILDQPLVATSFFYPRQDWFSWPSTYGVPTSHVHQSDMVVFRNFGSHLIFVDFSAHITTTL